MAGTANITPMSDPNTIQPLAITSGRFMLLREEDASSVAYDHQAPPPRVRRYHLSRVGGRPARGINPGPRQPGDFSHLRLTHD